MKLGEEKREKKVAVQRIATRDATDCLASCPRAPCRGRRCAKKGKKKKREEGEKTRCPNFPNPFFFYSEGGGKKDGKREEGGDDNKYRKRGKGRPTGTDASIFNGSSSTGKRGEREKRERGRESISIISTSTSFLNTYSRRKRRNYKKEKGGKGRRREKKGI